MSCSCSSAGMVITCASRLVGRPKMCRTFIHIMFGANNASRLPSFAMLKLCFACAHQSCFITYLEYYHHMDHTYIVLTFMCLGDHCCATSSTEVWGYNLWPSTKWKEEGSHSETWGWTSGESKNCRMYTMCIAIHIQYLYRKNTWVTLTTFLGCLSCISVTKECYQIDFLNWKFIEELFIS